MILTKLKRTIKSGAISFYRNGSVSLASVLILTVTLTVITMVLFSGVVLSSTLETIKNKVDVDIYFTKGASEDAILSITNDVKKNPDIADVKYISKDQAYQNFKERHKDNEATIQALTEIGDNPLPASINVKAIDPNKYDTIVTFLKDKESALGEDDIIDKINYTEKNQQAIASLNRIINASNKLGFLVAIFFAIVSILITFNTVRLAIYIFREEVSVMRLVGASETYIRAPFVTVGILYGLVGAIVTTIILLPITHYAGNWTEKLGTGVNLFTYFKENIFIITLLLILAGSALGAISSFLAIKKYLKV
jgi:cell division transport system permease protein